MMNSMKYFFLASVFFCGTSFSSIGSGYYFYASSVTNYRFLYGDLNSPHFTFSGLHSLDFNRKELPEFAELFEVSRALIPITNAPFLSVDYSFPGLDFGPFAEVVLKVRNEPVINPDKTGW